MTDSYKINEFIELRLENKETNIYVCKKRFFICKSLFINIPSEFGNTVNSIDDAEEYYDLEDSLDYKLDVREEFWGHCSNLQAWVENGYDSKIMHRNLAFPLLKRLSLEIHNIKIREALSREIEDRWKRGSENVRKYLRIQGFLDINKDINKFELNYSHVMSFKEFYYIQSFYRLIHKNSGDKCLLNYAKKHNCLIIPRFMAKQSHYLKMFFRNITKQSRLIKILFLFLLFYPILLSIYIEYLNDHRRIKRATKDIINSIKNILSGKKDRRLFAIFEEKDF